MASGEKKKLGGNMRSESIQSTTRKCTIKGSDVAEFRFSICDYLDDLGDRGYAGAARGVAVPAGLDEGPQGGRRGQVGGRAFVSTEGGALAVDDRVHDLVGTLAKPGLGLEPELPEDDGHGVDVHGEDGLDGFGVFVVVKELRRHEGGGPHAARHRRLESIMKSCVCCQPRVIVVVGA